MAIQENTECLKMALRIIEVYRIDSFRFFRRKNSLEIWINSIIMYKIFKIKFFLINNYDVLVIVIYKI